MAKVAYAIMAFFIFSLLFVSFTSKGRIVPFIDHSFLAGLFFLIIGAVIHVTKSGFFSFFIKSFKKFNKFPGHSRDEEADPMLKEERDDFYKTTQTIFLSTGLILILTSVAALCFI